MTPDWITSLDSYAIPTMHGGVDAVKPYVDEFIEYAKQHVLKRIFLKKPKLCCGYSWKICNLLRSMDRRMLMPSGQIIRAIVLPDHDHCRIDSLQ